jgi:hypothetical protein
MEPTMLVRQIVLPFLLPLLAASALAQKPCPYTRAERIAASELHGPTVPCSGLSFTSHGLQLSTKTGCPLFVVIIPEHHDIVPSTAPTRAETIGARQSRILFFTCQTEYFLIIPVGSKCVFDRDVANGAYPVVATMPCEDK